MKEIPSAEEFYIQQMKEFYKKIECSFPEELIKMAAPIAAKYYIEFAKLHVTAALEHASNNAKINVEAKFKGETRNSQSNAYFYDFKEMGGKREIGVYKDSILNAYDLNLIK